MDIERFPSIFADDIDPDTAAVLAVAQRPLSAAVFGEPAASAAWRDTPAWGIVATGDRAINPDVERFGYERAGVESTEIASSHLVMLAQPAAVVGLIETAIASIAR